MSHGTNGLVHARRVSLEPSGAAARALRVAAILCLCAAAACASSGREFSVDSVPLIQRGRWTQIEIERTFGKPQGVLVRGSGLQVWRYRYEERRTMDTGTLTRIGAFIARLFGQPVVGSPVNIRSSEVTVYRLDVEFDGEGVVTDYTYSRDTQPSGGVY